MFADDTTIPGWTHPPGISLTSDRPTVKKSRDLNAAYGVIVNSVLGAGIIGWTFAICYYLLVMR